MRALREDPLLLALTRDGRIAEPAALDALRERLPGATDCFLFCHGWLTDRGEAREGAARFFAELDGALRRVGDRVRPVRVALHWPSKPFADADPEHRGAREAAWPEPLGGLGSLARQYNPGAAQADQPESPNLPKPPESVDNRRQASTAP